MNIPLANNKGKRIIMYDNTSSNKIHLKKINGRKLLIMVSTDSSNIHQWWNYTYNKVKKNKENG